MRLYALVAQEPQQASRCWQHASPASRRLAAAGGRPSRRPCLDGAFTWPALGRALAGERPASSAGLRPSGCQPQRTARSQLAESPAELGDGAGAWLPGYQARR